MKKFDKDKYLRKLKLKRLWNKYQRYVYLGVSCLMIVFIGIYFTHSKFTTTSEEEVIRTTVGNFIYGDVIATPYIDGEYSLTFPEKKTGINVEKIVCDNDTSASWDEEKWGLMVTNLSKRTKCSIYFVTPASCGINDNVSCISSREELATLATEVNNGDNKTGKIIYLTSDLDLGGKFDSDGNALDGNISWTPIGTDIEPFSGTFDGNGHIITNMYINRPNDNRLGLFGDASYGTIKNLGIEFSLIIGNAYIAAISAQSGRIENSYNAATIIGNGVVAGICGVYCNVRNTYNYGNITNNGKADIAAGILGGASGEQNKSVHNSYNYGNIRSSKASTGGIAGWNVSVYNSYNFGTVSASNTSWTGGILGAFHNTINLENNYNIGETTGGGIVGLQEINSGLDFIKPYIKNNYYLKDTSSYGIFQYQSNYNAEPLTKDQMPSVISVINGDNAFVEDTNNINNGYPILKWQAERENN